MVNQLIRYMDFSWKSFSLWEEEEHPRETRSLGDSVEKYRVNFLECLDYSLDLRLLHAD